MTEHLEPGSIQSAGASPAVAEELLGVIQGVEGVSAVYPAQPLWQSIAGAAMAAVTGEILPLVSVTGDGDALEVKARIGVGTLRPAPSVAREVAGAVRTHLLPRDAAVEVYVVKVGP